MIIGFGTGRSGSVSFSEVLNIWHELKIDGKYLSELDNKDAWLRRIVKGSETWGKTEGDVSLDHINNLNYWLRQDVTRICLMRGREETVDSLENYFTRRIWQRLFPQFDFEKREDLYRYYDWYYDTILKHEDKFIIINPEQFDTKLNKTRKR